MKFRGPGSAALAVIAVATSTMSCSILFTTGPDSATAPGAARKMPDCSTSRAPAIVDTIIGTYQVVRTGLAIGADDSVYRDSPLSREADIGLGVALTGLFAVSAVHGFSATDACDDAQRTWLIRRQKRRARPPGPAVSKPAPPPPPAPEPPLPPAPEPPPTPPPPDGTPAPATDAGTGQPEGVIHEQAPF